MTSLKKSATPNQKIFFIANYRHAESFEPLNSSLPLLVPELHSWKAMCNLVVLAQILNLPDTIDLINMDFPGMMSQKCHQDLKRCIVKKILLQGLLANFALVVQEFSQKSL